MERVVDGAEMGWKGEGLMVSGWNEGWLMVSGWKGG